jgi:hypothetical protein
MELIENITTIYSPVKAMTITTDNVFIIAGNYFKFITLFNSLFALISY